MGLVSSSLVQAPPHPVDLLLDPHACSVPPACVSHQLGSWVVLIFTFPSHDESGRGIYHLLNLLLILQGFADVDLSTVANFGDDDCLHHPLEVLLREVPGDLSDAGELEEDC